MNKNPNHSSTRRHFLRAAGAIGAVAAILLAGPSLLARADDAPKAAGGHKLRVLIFGGTGFIGPHMIEQCLAKGYSVTMFNRGKTEQARKKIGRELPFMDKVEVLYGNRDPEKRADDNDPNSPKGLESLKGKQFDVVIDDSGYFPRMVKASAEMMAAAGVKEYLFISSISAYAKNDKPNMDESDELGTMSDPTVEDMGKQFENYGPLKVLCEKAVEAAFPGKCAIVRPGFIVGPGDSTDRFTYWPWRASQGGEMLLPGTPEVPIQFIDARDLAAFCVHLVEDGITGTYNATGPEKLLTSGQFFDACIAASSNKPTPVWVPFDFIEKEAQGLGAQGKALDLTIWIPNAGESAGFHTRLVAKAVKTGLRFRPLDETIKDTMAWLKTLPPERQAKLRAGMSLETEAEVLKAWKASKEGEKKGG